MKPIRLAAELIDPPEGSPARDDVIYFQVQSKTGPVQSSMKVESLLGHQAGPILDKLRIDPASRYYGFNLEEYQGPPAGKRGYSAHGEYGILKEIARRLNIKKGIACEFGAWDGMHASNTFELVKNEGWRCIMIEPDPERFAALQYTARAFRTIEPYQEIIHYLPNKGILLDKFLAQIEIPPDFDVLSIDIDSCDYQVWDSLKNYFPKVVVIEADNLDLNIIQREGISHRCLGGGTCFPPMKKLGESKGYTLVAYTYNEQMRDMA